MIYILTYDSFHRKTQDLLLRLKATGVSEVHVLISPWENRRNHVPLIPHRPTTTLEVDIATLCERLSFKSTKIDSFDEIPPLEEEDYILIGGAGILPKKVVKSGKVINSHPGYLPYCRGLDSYKWAIYEGKPIGVTTHIVSEGCDTGKLIKAKMVPLYSWDTFHSVAQRQYELEIDMLVESIEDLKTSKLEPIDETRSLPKRRMKHSMEVRLLSRFQQLIDKCEI